MGCWSDGRHSHYPITPTLQYSLLSMHWPWSKRRPDARALAGLWGENVAERHLAAKGFRILGRRVRVGHREEIDLVARDGRVLVFVEVKTRTSERFGRPSESVDRAKRKAQSRAALRYMRRLTPRSDYFRFDVVEVIGETGGDPVIRHIENAFTLAPGLRIPW